MEGKARYLMSRRAARRIVRGGSQVEATTGEGMLSAWRFTMSGYDVCHCRDTLVDRSAENMRQEEAGLRNDGVL